VVCKRAVERTEPGWWGSRLPARKTHDGAPTGSVAAANVSSASFGLLKSTAADIERTGLPARHHAGARRAVALDGVASPVDGEGAAMPCSQLRGGRSMPAVSSVAIQPRSPIWPVLIAPLVSGVYYMCLPVLLFVLASVQAFAQAPPARVVIQAGTVLDGKGGVLRNQQIVIEGAIIRSVAAGTAMPTYDLRALTVMPGWIDTHVHMNWHMDANHKSERIR
jgi:hypothetical protein